MDLEQSNPLLGSTDKGVVIGNIEIHEPVNGIVWLHDTKSGDGQTVPEAELLEVLQTFYNARF